VDEQILAAPHAQEVAKNILSKLLFKIMKNFDLYRIKLTLSQVPTTEFKLVGI
jgi:hypothetical protein